MSTRKPALIYGALLPKDVDPDLRDELSDAVCSAWSLFVGDVVHSDPDQTPMVYGVIVSDPFDPWPTIAVSDLAQRTVKRTHKTAWTRAATTAKALGIVFDEPRLFIAMVVG